MFNFPYIRRELEAPILRGTLRNRAELILGPRQVGKSTMLDHLVQNQRFIKLTGEDEDDLSILADPKTFLTLTQQFPNVIIDEAQFVPNIGRVIKRNQEAIKMKTQTKMNMVTVPDMESTGP